jgi:hypothetical protein
MTIKERLFKYEVFKVNTFHGMDYYLRLWIMPEMYEEIEISELQYINLGDKEHE